MKFKLITFLALFSFISCRLFAQSQDGGRIYYRAQPGCKFYIYNIINKTVGKEKQTCLPLKFVIDNTTPITINGIVYYRIKFLPIKNDSNVQVDLGDENGSISIKDNATCINSSDNLTPFLVLAVDITLNDQDSAIDQRYMTYSWRPSKHGIQFTYGANISTPFKFRPEIDGMPYKFDPAITLGGYFGVRGRLTPKGSNHLYFPIVSAGFSGIQISSDDQIEKNDQTGMAQSWTMSTGFIFQLNNFQIGGMIGWDFVAGSQGKNWRYNEKAWLSLGIGYNFWGEVNKEKNNDKTTKDLIKTQTQEELNNLRPTLSDQNPQQHNDGRLMEDPESK